MRWEAGVWEQGQGFVTWSYHATERAAMSAARRYARQLRRRATGAGGLLSWSGGWRLIGADAVVWTD